MTTNATRTTLVPGTRRLDPAEVKRRFWQDSEERKAKEREAKSRRQFKERQQAQQQEAEEAREFLRKQGKQAGVRVSLGDKIRDAHESGDLRLRLRGEKGRFLSMGKVLGTAA